MRSDREGGAAYRADSLGRVQSSDERMFIANMTESDWTAYTVVSDETLYDIVLEVHTIASFHYPSFPCTPPPSLLRLEWNARSMVKRSRRATNVCAPVVCNAVGRRAVGGSEEDGG